MIKLRLVLLTITFLNCVATIYSQEISDRSFLYKRFEIGGTSADSLSEYGFNLAVDMNAIQSMKVTVRLCSKSPLPIAISAAAVNPLILATYLVDDSNSKPSIAFNRIVVDRSDKCLGKHTSNVATELWEVLNNKSLPATKETINACQIRIRDFKSRKDSQKGVLLGTYNHKLAIRKIIQELKRNPNAIGSVIGYYIDRPTTEILEKLSVAKKMLRRSGLRSNRYDVRIMIWTGFPEIDRPKYLETKTVEVGKTCVGISDSRKTIFVD